MMMMCVMMRWCVSKTVFSFCFSRFFDFYYTYTIPYNCTNNKYTVQYSVGDKAL
jgi:hypothetical protein